MWAGDSVSLAHRLRDFGLSPVVPLRTGLHIPTVRCGLTLGIPWSRPGTYDESVSRQDCSLDPNAERMIPIHFGSSERLLAGIYTAARGTRQRRGVVLCNPFGMEALRAHRSLRTLSEALAEVGLDAFRFDYYGTGDSFGEAAHVSLEGWSDDVASAVRELKALGGVDLVDLVGLRLGAWAALKGSRKGEGVRRILLWDPVFPGTRAAGVLLESQAEGNSSPGKIEVEGFPVSSTLAEELRESQDVKLSDLDSSEVLVMMSSGSGDRGESDVPLWLDQQQVVPDHQPWVEEHDFGAGAVPVRIIEKIVAWLK